MFLAVLCLTVPHDCIRADGEWQTVKGRHFLVFHRGSMEFAEQVLKTSERTCEEILEDLDFTKRDNFWLWENRVKIHIHATRREYLQSYAVPEWSAGMANYKKREIATFAGSTNFVDSTLAHEIAHLILREFIGSAGTDAEVPVWLNEGVALWFQSPDRSNLVAKMVALRKSGRMEPLARLVTRDIRREPDSQKVSDFYTQSVDLVSFLLKRHGGERFRKFCGQIREGKELEEALRFTYPDTIRTITDLERLWMTDVPGTR